MNGEKLGEMMGGGEAFLAKGSRRGAQG